MQESMTFRVTYGKDDDLRILTVEVYYDEQPCVEPGWCWRGKGPDSVLLGGGPLEAEGPLEALEETRALFGGRVLPE